jgi:hypothetical protein
MYVSLSGLSQLSGGLFEGDQASGPTAGALADRRSFWTKILKNSVS